MEDDRAMGTSYLPSDISIQKHVNIHVMFYLSNGYTLCICPLFDGEGFVPFVSMLQFQQSLVTKGNMETLLYLKLITQPMRCNNTKLPAEHETKPPMRYNFTHFLFHNTSQKYITL